MSNETIVVLTPHERVVLNQAIVDKQGITEEGVDTITAVHGLLDGVLENPEDYDDPVALVEAYELWLQELWGFPQDRNYHIHWVRLKGCTCPKMDNRLAAGADIRYISRKCPWHGDNK